MRTHRSCMLKVSVQHIPKIQQMHQMQVKFCALHAESLAYHELLILRPTGGGSSINVRILTVASSNGKKNWRLLRRGAAVGAVAAGRLLHLHLQVEEVAPKREAEGAKAGTLMAACLFQRRATPCPAAALSAAILPTSPMPAPTAGDSYHLPATWSLCMYRNCQCSLDAEACR